MDEAAGIHRKIWEAVDKLLTTKSQKLCVIGNPTMSKGDFVDCFKDARFNKITVSVYDSPNYKAGKEVIPGLSGRKFVEQTKNKYGEHSNFFKAMVTGEIPDEDVDSLIPISWIEKAEGREVDFPFKSVKRFVTWDVADGGDDLHVIKAWENTTEIDSTEVRGKKVEEVEPYVWRLVRKINGNCIVVDADGVGRVAVGLLDQSKSKDVKVIPFEGSSREVHDPNTFHNRRHEAHWAMREMFEKNQLPQGDWKRFFRWDGNNAAINWFGRQLPDFKRYPTDLTKTSVHLDGLVWASALMAIYDRLGRHLTDQLNIQSHYYLTAPANMEELNRCTRRTRR